MAAFLKFAFNQKHSIYYHIRSMGFMWPKQVPLIKIADFIHGKWIQIYIIIDTCMNVCVHICTFWPFDALLNVVFLSNSSFHFWTSMLFKCIQRMTSMSPHAISFVRLNAIYSVTTDANEYKWLISLRRTNKFCIVDLSFQGATLVRNETFWSWAHNLSSLQNYFDLIVDSRLKFV